MRRLLAETLVEAKIVSISSRSLLTLIVVLF
jgi:hypothetical protein